MSALQCSVNGLSHCRWTLNGNKYKVHTVEVPYLRKGYFGLQRIPRVNQKLTTSWTDTKCGQNMCQQHVDNKYLRICCVLCRSSCACTHQHARTQTFTALGLHDGSTDLYRAYPVILYRSVDGSHQCNSELWSLGALCRVNQ